MKIWMPMKYAMLLFISIISIIASSSIRNRSKNPKTYPAVSLNSNGNSAGMFKKILGFSR